MAPEQALVSLGSWLVLGLLACLAATLAARVWSRHAMWYGWASVVGVLVISGVIRLAVDPFGRTLGLGYAAFMIAAAVGIPSAGAVAVAVRRSSREPRGSKATDFLLVGLTFILLLPIGAIVAVAPDAIHLFW